MYLLHDSLWFIGEYLWWPLGHLPECPVPQCAEIKYSKYCYCTEYKGRLNMQHTISSPYTYQDKMNKTNHDSYLIFILIDMICGLEMVSEYCWVPSTRWLQRRRCPTL